MAGLEVKGVIPAMVTPFTKDGEIDVEGLRGLARWLIDCGVDGLFPLGTIGEGPKLGREERTKVLRAVLEEAKAGIPVIPGTGAMTTRDAITYTRDAKDLGAQAAVIHPPSYYHPSPRALLSHYKAVAEKTDFPIILYNLPSFVGYSIPIEVVVEAAKDPNVIGIKDSSADMLYYQALLNQTPNGFNVIQGYGSLFLPSLILGAKATLCGEGNVAPKVLVEMYKSYLRGDYGEARRLHFKLVTLVSVMGYGTFPVAVKEAMNVLGLPGGYALPPAEPLSEQEKEGLKEALKRAGLMEE
ncbi:TPA: 4-hydroxy-tetrahydrodipicolinate synthase [Candidatus Bathyarchaeota archaeon]|nr:4-hydroxy-tetrahydrodipicolinate synthase [Candidatus Bathyarchaeota archaeon]